MIKHLDLFSGIGGFALAADRVFGKVNHTFCEIDPFCQEVLKKHWPKAKIYGDIRTLTTNTDSSRHLYNKLKEQSTKTSQQKKRKFESSVSAPFILTGGFPCQPFSQAGRRKGTEDDRYLWPEMLRVIREFAPLWVIGENVGGFVTWNDGMVLRQVFSDLENEGYEIQAFIIPAVSLNAPHRRDRIWIIAHASGSQYRGGARPTEKTNGIQKIDWEKIRSRGISGTDKFIKNPKYQPEGNSKQNRFNQRTSVRITRSNKDDADTQCAGYTGKVNQKGQSTRHSGRPQSPDWSTNWFEVATSLCRMDDGLPKRLDRNPRLKALGNAIVPEVAEEIMKAIKFVSNF